MSPPAADGVPPTARFPWALVAIAAAILVVFRLRAFGLPLETDECNYAYIAARLLAGDRLYVDVWDHQPFGVFAFLAAVIAVAGDGPAVFRLLALAFSLGSLLLIAAILRCVHGPRAAVLGAVLFAVASSDPGTGGEGCNREIYMNTLILAAWYFALRATVRPTGERAGTPAAEAMGSKRSLWLFGAGVALALASTLKPVVAVHWVCLAGWLMFSHRRNFRAAFATVLWFCCGPLLVWVIASAYFFITGRWGAYVEAVFGFNVGYGGSGEPFYLRFGRFFRPVRHPFIFETALPLWIAGAAAVLWVAGRSARRRLPAGGALLAFVLAGYLATCLSGRFWPHYYYLLIPPVVLVVSIMAGACADRLSNAILATGVFLILPLLLLGWETRYYLLRPTHRITAIRYNFRDYWGRAQGWNVASVTEPDDTVFVFGNDASIYYYSGRRCASRFTMITGLASSIPGFEERRRILMEELRGSRPRVILVLFDEKPFPEWLAFLEENYGEAVGADYHDTHREDRIMLVFALKERPIRTIDWNWDRRILEAPGMPSARQQGPGP